MLLTMRLTTSLLLFACLSRSAAGEVVLRGVKWDVAIHPDQLAVDARPKAGGTLCVSSPRSARVAELKQTERKISWTIPDENVSVTMHLDGDVLVVSFKATQSGAFKWPVVAPDARTSAYLLPIFEGVYVPADDEPWAKFLLKESPLNTTAGLSMPFWGVNFGPHTLTYTLTNPYNNEIEFKHDAGRLGLELTHEFTRNQPVKEFGFRIHLGDSSPVGPAKVYRQHLIESGEFVSLKTKIQKTPEVAKLLGAPHVYLWGDGLIARGDIRDYKSLASALPNQKRVWDRLRDETRALLTDLPNAERVDNFQKGQIVEDLSGVLKRGDLTAAQLHEAFPDLLNPPDTWGDGLSVKMVQVLADAGIDRAWLGSSSWDGLALHPDTVAQATQLGYLIGPYDSYHSIHAHGAADTWETAQFDDGDLYEAGAIVKADGSKRKGFKQKGHLLSPAAARPHVEKRVAGLMKQFGCNSWFIDCDAFGEVFDDYSPAHPMTQAEDAASRLSRMAWIRDTYGAVIGSEGGSAYAAPVIHFAHGIMTPVVAWGDMDMMKDKSSKYYLGGYYPPDGPAIFFKQVPLKDEYRRIYADPRFRLPLYQIVFHDSVVATHQWGYGSLKFADRDGARELLEMLYNVPPLYHLNLAEWQKRKDEIKRRFDFFSPLHRAAALLPMSDFRWLTDDRMVQVASFGDDFTLTANFRPQPYLHGQVQIPGQSVLLRRLKGGPSLLYQAQVVR